MTQTVLDDIHRRTQLVHGESKSVTQLLNVRNAQMAFADVGNGLLANGLTVGAIAERNPDGTLRLQRLQIVAIDSPQVGVEYLREAGVEQIIEGFPSSPLPRRQGDTAPLTVEVAPTPTPRIATPV